MVKYFTQALEDKEKQYIDECVSLCKSKKLCRSKQDWLILATTVLREKIDNE